MANLHVRIMAAKENFASLEVVDDNGRQVAALEVYIDAAHPFVPVVYASAGRHTRQRVQGQQRAAAT